MEDPTPSERARPRRRNRNREFLNQCADASIDLKEEGYRYQTAELVCRKVYPDGYPPNLPTEVRDKLTKICKVIVQKTNGEVCVVVNSRFNGTSGFHGRPETPEDWNSCLHTGNGVKRHALLWPDVRQVTAVAVVLNKHKMSAEGSVQSLLGRVQRGARSGQLGTDAAALLSDVKVTPPALTRNPRYEDLES